MKGGRHSRHHIKGWYNLPSPGIYGDSFAVIRELVDGRCQFYSIVEKLKKEKRATEAFSEGSAIQPSTSRHSLFCKDTINSLKNNA